MNLHCIVQARMASSRFPNKVLKKIGNYFVIELLIKRLSLSKLINKIIVATSENKSDDILVDFLKKMGISIIRGSEDNVLQRYNKAQNRFKSDIIIRITGDCPFIDSKLVDEMLDLYLNSNFDYISNINPPSFPDGLDVEIFSSQVLKTIYELASNKFDLEHVTPYILKNSKFKKYNFKNKIDYSKYRWTLDEPVDLKVLNKLFNLVGNRYDFFWKDILKYPSVTDKLSILNSNITRNEGQIMSSGQKHWKRAKKVIPGGTMLLSKRPDQFHPEKWPAYFSKAKDCYVWDLDNRKY